MSRWLTLVACFLVACAGARGRSPVVPERLGLPLRFDSAVNGAVYVEERGPWRVLRFSSGTLQTQVDPLEPSRLVAEYTQAFLLAFCLREPDPRALDRLRVSMVGLGGGAIPRFLRRHFPGMRMDVVELDPVVVRVAKKYFFVREDARYRIHVGDGRQHLEKVAGRYDVIVLDAFGGSTDEVPRQLTSVEFLRTVQSRLAPGGLVAANFIFVGEKPIARVLKTYETVFRHVFRFPLKGPRSGNVLVFATDAAASMQAAADLPARARRLEAYTGAKLGLAAWAATLGRYPIDLRRVIPLRDRRPAK